MFANDLHFIFDESNWIQVINAEELFFQLNPHMKSPISMLRE